MVAPSQILFTLAVRAVGDAGDIALTGLDEEGASLGGDEGGVLCGGGGGGGSSEDGTAADARICVIVLRRKTEMMRYTGKRVKQTKIYRETDRRESILLLQTLMSRWSSSLSGLDEPRMGVLQ